VLLATSLVLVSAAASATAAEVPRALARRARAEGSARVLVRLDAPAAPQALAAGGAAAGKARAQIAAGRARLEEALAGTDWASAREFDTIPWVAITATPDALEALAASGAALAIGEDRLESVDLVNSVPMVQADQAQAAGFDGTGWTIAVLDTGIDGSHPFLAGKVVSEACYSANGSCPDGSSSQVGPGSAGACGYAPNSCPHGTHVAGIAAGRGDGMVGVAPGATLISLQVFSRFTGSVCEDDIEDPCAKTYTSDNIAALERVYELRDTYRIAAANLSFGGGRFFSEGECDAEDAARKAIVDNLRAAGIVTISASGNSRWTDSTTAPACLTSAIAVGAVTSDDVVAEFSNTAPFLDFLAPGVRILSAVPPGAYARLSGTSQAAPHVAGAFAILAQRLGAASPDVILSALRDTALYVTDPRVPVVMPRILIKSALDTLPAPPTRGSGLQITPDGRRMLVSKDIGTERWAITENASDRSVTGNVFREGGGPVSFVFCERLGDDGNPDPYAIQIRYGCQGASACTDATCSTSPWSPLGETTLAGAFFLPPPASSASTALANDVVEDGAETVAQGDAPAGAQITPDAARRSLVSKDIGTERWAITRHPDDGTVTGNVFRQDGSDPAFVFCTETGRNGSDVSYACSGADRCDAAPCSPSQFTFIADATLPDAFFLP
jgi:subtilisin family serine protease